MEQQPYTFSEPAQRYKKEIDQEYLKFQKDNPNLFRPGVRIPYRDYIRSRSLAWLRSMATVPDIIEVQNIIQEKRAAALHEQQEDSPLIEVDTEFLNAKPTEKPNEV